MSKSAFTAAGFPRSRVATFDIGVLSRRRHYVTALLELRVGEARRRIKALRAESGERISFTAWLLTVIAAAVHRHPEAAAFRKGRRHLVIPKDVDISVIVEKELEGKKVPLPLVIRKVQNKSAVEVTAEIDAARRGDAGGDTVVLEHATSRAESLYYLLPGPMRRLAWRLMLKRPRYLFKRMGNVVVTAVGMMGKVNGWFIQTSVHPLAFGIGAITRKPVAEGDTVIIDEVLHMTVLLDHDAVDGAPMARFLADLTASIEAPANL